MDKKLKHKWKRKPTFKKTPYGGKSTYICEICGCELHISYACLPVFGCIERKSPPKNPVSGLSLKLYPVKGD